MRRGLPKKNVKRFLQDTIRRREVGGFKRNAISYKIAVCLVFFAKHTFDLSSSGVIPREIGNNCCIGDNRREQCTENEERGRDQQHILLLIVESDNNNNGTGGANTNNNFKYHGLNTVKLVLVTENRISYEKHGFRVSQSK